MRTTGPPGVRIDPLTGDHKQMSTPIRSHDLDDQRGASMVEYGLMLGLIAAVAFGAVTLMGISTLALFPAGL